MRLRLGEAKSRLRRLLPAWLFVALLIAVLEESMWDALGRIAALAVSMVIAVVVLAPPAKRAANRRLK